NPLMGFTLTANISTHSSDSRLAYRKRSVTCLPIELRPARVMCPQPDVRTGFQPPYCVTQRDCPTQQEQSMDVVRLGVDLDGHAFQALQRPAHVSVEIRPDFVGETALSTFCGEHEMRVNLGERLGHMCFVYGALSGSERIRAVPVTGHRLIASAPG